MVKVDEYPWSRILALCREKDTSVLFVDAEGWRTAAGDDEITVTEPFPEANPVDADKRENLQGLVMRYRFKSLRVLYTGDLEREGMLRYLKQRPGKMTIVKAPHHGSQDSGWEWIWALKPKLVVCQASATARKVSADRMGDWLERAGIPLATTGLDGALEWNSDGVSCSAGTYSSGRKWEWKLNIIHNEMLGRIASRVNLALGG